MSGRDHVFFEGLLDKILKQHDINTLTKDEIISELNEVKQELIESKQYYEQYLMKIKLDCEETIRKAAEDVQSKSQIVTLYQEEKQKVDAHVKSLKGKLNEYEEILTN